MTKTPPARLLVLIVDDDEDSLRLTGELVLQADPQATVVLAHGGPHAKVYLSEATAPDLARTAIPDLILLDVNMPGANGYDVLRWLRQVQALAAVTVVMHSTGRSSREIERATELGAQGYLLKFPAPVVLASLLRQVRETGRAGCDAVQTLDSGDAVPVGKTQPDTFREQGRRQANA